MAALHFRDEIHGGQMTFPYVAHRGVAAAHNALRLLELTGYPDDLVQRARRFAEAHHPRASSGS
jgi:DNA mismatch repair ATPase MutS